MKHHLWLTGLQEYEAGRHLADARAVTRLSAYVHHGQLSARLLHAETAKRGSPQHCPMSRCALRACVFKLSSR